MFPSRPLIRAYQFSRFRSPSSYLALILLVGAATVSSAQNETEIITEAKASKEGRFIAVAYANGELGILDLQYPGRLPIFTRYLNGGFAWSPASMQLAFIERYPGQAPLLWLVHPAGGRDASPLVGGTDWKAFPAWLDENRIAYLSDRDSDHANIWMADAETGETKMLLDCGVDVTGLWVLPKPGEFIYRSAQSGSPELWWHWADSNKPIRLTHDEHGQSVVEDGVVVAPSRRAFAYSALSLDGAEVVYYDLRQQVVRARLTLDSPPDSLAIHANDEVIVGRNSRLYRWKVNKRSRKLSPLVDWYGTSLRSPFRVGPDGWGVVANDSLILTAERIDRLGDARIHSRQVGDLVALTAGWQLSGKGREARSLIEDLWRTRQSSASDGFAIGATRAWIERMRGNSSRFVRRLDEALAMSKPKRADVEAAWQERLFVELFDRRDEEAARDWLDQKPREPGEAMRLDWARELLDDADPASLDDWQRIGNHARRKRWSDCAASVARRIAGGGDSALDRRGIELLLRAGFEPLAERLGMARPIQKELLALPEFQRVLLYLCKDDLSDDTPEDELRGLLLLQWAQSGETTAARKLVQIDLSDSDGSALDYVEILDRYLDAEEQDVWMEKAVAEVFLAPETILLLNHELNDTRGRLVLRLALAKRAHIDGDMERLDEILGQLETQRETIPETYWDWRTARLRLLICLFRAKFHERAESWVSALESYDRCAEIIDDYPEDWGVLAFDLAHARAAIRAGRDDAEALGSLLRVVRGLGDPMVNPAHEVAPLRTSLDKVRSLRFVSGSPWLAAYLGYIEGASLAGLGRPYEAVEALRYARSRPGAVGVRGRILLEEATVRSSLGQHQLASQLMKELCELELAPPQLAAAIKIRAQNESQSGLVQSEEDRIRYLCRALRLPQRWAAVLIAHHTVLPLDEELEGRD